MVFSVLRSPLAPPGNEERMRLEEQMKWKERERREEELRKRIPNPRNPRD